MFVILVVAFASLIGHVLNGGFAADDWVDASRYVNHAGSGFWNSVLAEPEAMVLRMPSAVLRAGEWWLFGTSDPVPHMAWMAFAATLETVLFYALLRMLRMPNVLAVAASLMMLLLPFADSSALWNGDTIASFFSRGCTLLGLIVALRFLNARLLPCMIAQLAALALFYYGVSGYELGAPLILLGGLVYFRRTVWWKALALWLFALGAVLWAKWPMFSTLPTSFSYIDQHGRQMLSGGEIVLANALVPISSIQKNDVLIPAMIVVAVGLVAAGLTFRREAGRFLVHQLAILLGGLLATLAGWVMLLPAGLGYNPLAGGLNNRVNAVAAMGFAIIVVGLAGVIVGIVQLLLPKIDLPRTMLVALLTLPIVAGDLVGFLNDATLWNRAAYESRAVLATIRHQVPDPRPGTTIFTFGVVGYTGPSIPIFGGGGSNDLLGAVQLQYRTSNVRAFPVIAAMQMTCNAKTVVQTATGIDSTTSYGYAIFLDVPHMKKMVPRNSQECEADLKALSPFAAINA